MAFSSKPTLIYYFDALCGWCYGFSPVITKIQANYQNHLAIEVVSGGLFLGDRIGLINEIAPYIKAGAYKTVEAHTGVTFGDAFLEELTGEGKIVLNSFLTAIALEIVKEQFPEQQVAFASLLLHGVYHDGISPIDLNALANRAVNIGMDKGEFLHKMEDSRYVILAQQGFEKFKSSGYSGMPTLALEEGNHTMKLATGYRNYEELSATLNQMLH